MNDARIKMDRAGHTRFWNKGETGGGKEVGRRQNGEKEGIEGRKVESFERFDLTVKRDPDKQ